MICKPGPKMQLLAAAAMLLMVGAVCVLFLPWELMLWRGVGGTVEEKHAEGVVGSRDDARDFGEESCTDPEWCDLPLPTDSLFRFSAPTNLSLWRIARAKAARGEQVLLRQVIEAIKTPMDFLVGDISFRDYHAACDYFLDYRNDFSFLTDRGASPKPYASPVPRPYLPKSRAALVAASYVVTEPRHGQYSGPHFFGTKRRMLYRYMDTLLPLWRRHSDRISKKFILLSSFDENWGILSTHFPNRTTNWTYCCTAQVQRGLRDLLDSDALVMLLINQHHNFSHPKLITLPRGLPLNPDNQRRLLWSTMLREARREKSMWVFTSCSSWGSRPALRSCVLDRIDPQRNRSDVEISLYNKQLRGRVGERAYYPRLASARMSIALPGLGYETYRLWEALTMGTVPVLEKGVGFDKMLWRLPALLVEDFSVLTPTLMRTAYVEALYRALRGEWEFRRLTQSFWWAFISSVARTQSSARILDFFPTEADERGWARPLQPMACAQSGTCGPGTLRSPASSC